MLREEYLRRLVDEAYIDLYLSGHDGARIYWPWRMQPVHEATKSYRNACEKYIVDSSFSKPGIGNEDVLDKAHKLDAEVAVLADVYQDKDATVKAILDGLETVDDHPFDGEIMAPLQAPHDSCYQSLRGQGIDMVAIGGLKNSSPDAQIAAAKSIRNIAGADVHIHGLGWGLRRDGGTANQLVKTIQQNPELIDSIDYSTPVQEAIHTMDSIDKGEERKSVEAAETGSWLIRDLRRVSSYPDVDNTTKQSQLV